MCTPLIALRSALDQYPDTGRAGVALALGKTDEVLRKETSGSSSGHKLGFVDAVRALETLQNAGVDIEAAVAAFAGHFGFRLAGQVQFADDADLNLLSVEASQRATQAAYTVVVAASDGFVSCNDKKAGQAALTQAKDALRILSRALAAQHARDNAGREAVAH